MPNPAFVRMYHPLLSNRQALVSFNSVDDHAAKGWLLVDGNTPAPATGFLTPAVADARYLRREEYVPGAGSSPSGASTRALGILHAGLAARSLAPCRLVFAGSSTTAGGNATTPANRYVNRLVAAIQAAYPADGGSESGVIASATAAFGTPSNVVGVHGYNAGQGGTTSSTYLTAAMRTSIAALSPRMVLHMVGANDRRDNISLTAFKANVLTSINDLKAKITGPCVHVLVHSYPRFDPRVDNATYTWAQYGQQLAAIAAADPDRVAFIDISGAYEVVGIPGTDPLSLIDTDEIHQTDAGHAFMADLLRQALMVAPPVGVGTPAPTPADTTAPTVPVTPVATAGVNSATVTTTGSTDAVGVTGYVWRRNGTTTISGAAGTSLNDTSLPANTPVFYTVAARDAAGNESAQSAASNTVTPTASTDVTPPTVPGTPTATAGPASAAVTFALSTDATGVTGYRVYSSADNYAAPVASGSSSPITAPAPAGTPVTLKVAAFDAAGNLSALSAASNSVTPTAAAPFVYDTVTGADNTNMTAHVGEVGATWVNHPSLDGSAANATIRGNRIISNHANVTRLVASGIPASPDYKVEWDVYFASVPTTVALNNGMAGRYSPTTIDGYYVRYIPTVGWRLDKAVAGVQTTLGTALASPVPTVGSTHHCELIMQGASIRALVDGTEIASVTDDSHTGPGRVLYMGTGVTSATTGTHIDNVTATNL